MECDRYINVYVDVCGCMRMYGHTKKQIYVFAAPPKLLSCNTERGTGRCSERADGEGCEVG